MVRCRAKGEDYSYDFTASLQNTNEQSILISERDLTAWKGAAERMLTNEIVLKVFSDYLNREMCIRDRYRAFRAENRAARQVGVLY